MSTMADHGGATPFQRALFVVLKEPVVYVAATTPIWSKWLAHVSELAAQLGPIFAIILAIARIWSVLHERTTERLDRVEKSGFLAASTVGVMAKLSAKWFAPVLAALGLVAIAAWMLSPTPAKAQPLVSQPAKVKGRKRSADDAGEDDGPIDGATFPVGVPPQWYLNARADLGQHERPGRQHNPVVVKYFRDAGHPEIKDDETAWCAAFVGANLERCGYVSSKSLSARSYENWGTECEPRLGCVVVMWRGSRSGWEGHVGFYAGETDTHVIVLGGNQGDAVSLAKFPKSRVLSYRWPRAATQSRTARAAAASAALVTTSEAATQTMPTPDRATAMLEAIEPVKGTLSQLGEFVPIAAKAALAIGIVLAIYAAVRRYRDFNARGI